MGGNAFHESNSRILPSIDIDARTRAGLSLDALEDLLLKASVARAEGNLAGAARLLGITRPQLSYRLKKKPGAEPGEEITRE